MALRRFWWVLLLVMVTVVSTGIAAAEKGAGVPRMTKDELKAKLGSQEVVVIDVRAESDWKNTKWKIKGAVREDPERVDSWIQKYPKEKTYVLYCA